ncbi:MAG TPA: cysteine peptidase family C39 domain-containing protein [Anaeromyxobacteraceae bacterium]|nr:cysteine peptidase family C39 domain-containing protein [Anaeromyxobacteraceae bacterium]
MIRVLAAIAGLLALAPEARAERRGPVRSLVELRQERVVRQGWDLSCGAAALSTLLTHDLGYPVSEAEIVAGILDSEDAAKVKRRGGFTLLDLKKFVVRRGHEAAGYGNLTLATLAPLAPAIVATEHRGQPHFMVFRGIHEDRVLLADPAFGNRTMRKDRFEAIWKPRVAFVVKAAPPAAPVAAAGGGR